MNTLDRLKILYRLGFDARIPKVFSFHDCLPEVFSQYIELLIYKRYRILGAQELSERIGSKTRFHKEVVLTFDDGRRNCWTVIFPLLKKFRAKAIFFIIPSKISESEEEFPNLQDYWRGRVSWENLYLSHRRQPYLTWRELRQMRESGLVEIFSHGLRHDVVSVSSRVVDFQHPGVYEMPVYFDEWFQSRQLPLDSCWGAPIFERVWATLASNVYEADQAVSLFMNEFVKNNGGFLFFKKKGWRQRLFEHYRLHKKSLPKGRFKKLESKEDAGESIRESKRCIETRLKNTCSFFSLPLFQSSPEIMGLIEEAGYRAVFSGLFADNKTPGRLFSLNRIPGFWIKFLSYF
jgi:hypothetical protein